MKIGAVIGKILSALADVFPEWLRRLWAARDEGEAKYEKAKQSLEEAIDSGDPDRIAAARRRMRNARP